MQNTRLLIAGLAGAQQVGSGQCTIAATGWPGVVDAQRHLTLASAEIRALLEHGGTVTEG